MATTHEARSWAAPSPPLVDVGIPTLGRRAYVHDAIESVRAQTYPNWRLLVSVNAADPEQDFSAYDHDPRIRIVRDGRPMTSYGNKNAIVRAGDAPYIALLDDDDVWEPGFLERRIELLEANPDCAFAFSTFREIDPFGSELNRGLAPFGREGVLAPEDVVPELLRLPSERRILTAMLTVVLRRSALESVGGRFDESFPVIADYALWLRLASRYPVVFLHSWDALYRRHPLQESASARLASEFLLVLDRMGELFDGADEQLRPDRAMLDRHRARWHLSLALDAGSAGRRRDALELVRRAGSISPATLGDRRLPAILLTLLIGRAASPLLAAFRARLRRRDLRPRV